MALTIYPVTRDFAAEVGDVDLGALSPEAFEEIRRLLWRYAVLIFPDQKLTPEQQLDFGLRFGPLDPPFGKATRSRVAPGLIDVSNIDADQAVWNEDSRLRLLREGDKHWHTDSSFNFTPALVSILYGKSIPPVGGFTEFADERAAYDALPQAMKARLDALVAEHSWFTSRLRYGMVEFPAEMREQHPPVPQMLVRTLPESGRKTLYLASHVGRIFGLAEEEGGQLIDELLAHATRSQFVYRHRWRAGDVVMWDNRCTMHRGTDYEDTRWARDFQRATISDIANSVVQAGLPLPAEAAVQAR
jgi:alpha-ketoglutarate-dependent 2,4-dichlorophenoxyacetate dioxygenase